MKNNLKIEYVETKELKPSDCNPRKWDEVSYANLKVSIKRFGIVDPIIVNSSPNRKNDGIRRKESR